MAKKTYWRTNEQIPFGNLRVIGKEGKQIGVLAKSEALKMAKKEGLDLVEIAPKAKPPVAKIINFGKFKYQEEKKAKKAKKGSKSADLKEVRLSPFIGEADYKTRLNRMQGFLKDGDKVRAVVKFKGRQMNSKQFGYGVLQRILGELETEVNIDMEPKFIGRHLSMVISPMTKNKKAAPKIVKDKKDDKKSKTKNKKINS